MQRSPQLARAWAAWAALDEVLRSGQLVVLDGGTGTELERQGVEMEQTGWSCAAQLFHPDAVRVVHGLYLEAGARIITANTYATNRSVLVPAGLEHRTAEALHCAVHLARQSIADHASGCRQAPPDTGGKGDTATAVPTPTTPTTATAPQPLPALVAGSLSTHPPAMAQGGHTSETASWPTPEEEYAGYVEAASALAALGVDLLFLEMMKDLRHAPLAIRAAARCGLPVFLGVSCRLQPDGALVLYGTGSDSIPFTEETLRGLVEACGPNLVGISVMHTNFSAMAPALAVVRRVWAGPLGCYPDHGAFTMPHWQFAELSLDDAAARFQSWIDEHGVGLIGGCCGLGPDLIARLSQLASQRWATATARSRPKQPPPSRRSVLL